MIEWRVARIEIKVTILRQFLRMWSIAVRCGRLTRAIRGLVSSLMVAACAPGVGGDGGGLPALSARDPPGGREYTCAVTW